MNGVKTTASASPCVMWAMPPMISESGCGASAPELASARPASVSAKLIASRYRKVDSEAIHRELDGGRIVLISPLGFSPTGEAFNLTSEDLAASIAGALKADKLILLTNVDGVRRFDEVVTELTAEDAREFINDKLVDEEDIYNLTFALKALEHGVERVHIVPYAMDGGLLAEPFTHDGVGT